MSNPIRELSRGMSKPTEAHQKEMYKVIKWVLENAEVGLRVKPIIKRNEEGK